MDVVLPPMARILATIGEHICAPAGALVIRLYSVSAHKGKTNNIAEPCNSRDYCG